MMTFLTALGPWNWIIAAAILLALELFAPGAFMMWLGLAAALVGVISLLFSVPWQVQCVLFAVFALASVPLWRRFARKVESPSTSPLLNRRAESLIGRVFTLDKPIVDGVGTVRIDDTTWRVMSGLDCPAGGRVRVSRVDGAVLIVEPAT